MICSYESFCDQSFLKDYFPYLYLCLDSPAGEVHTCTTCGLEHVLEYLSLSGRLLEILMTVETPLIL